MKSALVICAAVLLAACGTKSAEEKAQAPAPQPKEAKKNPDVTLDDDAQQRAGIVVQTVRREVQREAISATGQLTVNEDQTWSVGSLHEGRIVSVAVKVGDTVKKGQVLARMHSHDVHDSRAAYKRAALELARLQAAEAQSRRLSDRARRLFELKAVSQQEVEMADAELRNAHSAVQNAKNEVEKERIHLVEFLEVSLEDEGPQHDDDYIPVKAPESGILIERKATPGSVVSPGQEVFRITTPESIWMLANVNEADLSHLRAGQDVRVLVRAYPDRVFRGQILRVGEELDPTTRMLKVRVAVPNPGGMLKPEMYASAEIEHSSGREALFIPEGAIQDVSGNRVVFVRTAPHTFEARPVQTGRTVNGNVEVVAGVRPGDTVVVKSSFVLKSQLLRSAIEED
jgi:cobalt-zinc-cadmium efflux system membrane fusion protein